MSRWTTMRSAWVDRSAMLALVLACSAGWASAQGVAAPLKVAPAAAKPNASAKQYIYMLRLVPRLHDPSAWSDKEQGLVSAHFQRLSKAAETGQVILAGRTNEDLPKTFGLVIFEAADDAAAEAFMRDDPAVAGGVMIATVHPYSVALQRKR